MIKFHKLYEDAILPQRATVGSAGYDLRYYGKGFSALTLKPGEFMTFPTGVTLELTNKNIYFLQGEIRPRSGWAAKFGITVLNSPGTIDRDYYPREIGVILINHGKENFVVNHNDRIAQLVINHFYIINEDIPVDAERTGGFGSTDRSSGNETGGPVE